ncbi:hypothetical protein [Thalassospira marina]|uniref:Uncharacterized protein n=1 Tax=Thalassospira marina TaxID=2048283 RepID=A0A2N3KD33_9PROT|nr:hypothetical protein [Thalassospira marina]PKR48455.1 hypothetical protein COO20_24665 [Thalassospira marina]
MTDLYEKQDGEMRCFEAQIFNREVRDLLEAGELNDTGFDDTWADSRYISVWARSMTEAASFFARDFPTHAGFRIVSIGERGPEM